MTSILCAIAMLLVDKGYSRNDICIVTLGRYYSNIISTQLGDYSPRITITEKLGNDIFNYKYVLVDDASHADFAFTKIHITHQLILLFQRNCMNPPRNLIESESLRHDCEPHLNFTLEPEFKFTDICNPCKKLEPIEMINCNHR